MSEIQQELDIWTMCSIYNPYIYYIGVESIKKALSDLVPKTSNCAWCLERSEGTQSTGTSLTEGCDPQGGTQN